MRQYPRIEIDSLAAVRIEDGTIVQARIRDISPDGLRVLVTREDALVIHPGAKAIARLTRTAGSWWLCSCR